jgi:AcrR family transcriptional regulator
MIEQTARERRQEKTREAILQEARRLISANGVESFSLRELARQVDYSPAALYEYFSSKEEIIHAVCLEGHKRLAAALQAVPLELHPADHLTQIGLAYIDFATRNPDYYLLMFTVRTLSGAIITGMTEEQSAYRVLLDSLQRGLDAGLFKTRPRFGLQEMAYTAWSLVHGISMLRITYLDQTAADWPAVDRQALHAFGRGLAA